MTDRITRELNYLHFMMMEKMTNNHLLTPVNKELVMSMLKSVIDEMEYERLDFYGFPIVNPFSR